MRRVLGWLAGSLLVLFVVAYFARGAIARKVLEVGVSRQTGFPLKVDSLDFTLLGGHLEIRGLELMNPPEFHEKTFIDLPLLRVDYETASLLRRAPHIRELVVRVNQICVVTDESGEKNVKRLESRFGEPDRARPVTYRVDLLRVHVGTVLIEDWSGGKPSKRKLVLNTDETFRDLTNSTPLSELVLASALHEVGPALGEVSRTFGQTLHGTGKDLGKASRGLLDLFKKRR